MDLGKSAKADKARLTCATLVESEMADRDRSLRALFDRLESDDLDVNEEATEELANYGLGVSARVAVRVEISTGGPADWVEAMCEPTSRHAFQDRGDIIAYLEPMSMTYHYADWFDHAERPVDEDSALWRWVAEIIGSGVVM